MQNESEPSYRRLTIKKSDGRWFACKYGAWRENYKDWLALDSYRNEIIHYLITSNAMKLDNQKAMTVGESFYCGYSIELKQTGISNTDGFLYRFKPNGQLFVDQMVNNNINEEAALKYNYVTEINSEDDIPDFVKKIEADLLSRNKTKKE